MFSFSSALWMFASALVVTDGQVSAQFKVITCGRGSAHSLACKSGVIDVVNARYGPKEQTCCSDAGVDGPANPKCQQHSVTEGIQDRCDGKRVCEVHTGQCTGPCYVEYLQTWYNCAPAVLLIKCENTLVDIYCDLGTKIRILEAFYGRQDQTTCSEGQPPSEVEDVTCTAVEAPAIIKDRCDGSLQCTFTVNVAVLPNPCPNTFKYLQVKYYCKAS